jgi:hypothetical protein
MLLDTERSDQTGIRSNTAKLRPWPCITPYVPLQIPKPMGCIPKQKLTKIHKISEDLHSHQLSLTPSIFAPTWKVLWEQDLVRLDLII